MFYPLVDNVNHPILSKCKGDFPRIDIYTFS